MKPSISLLALLAALSPNLGARADEKMNSSPARADAKPLLLAQAQQTKSAGQKAADAADVAREERNRADERMEFFKTLAVPLSRAETRQYDALVGAERTASALWTKSSAACIAASEATEKAAPTEVTLLKVKQAALQKTNDADFGKMVAAGEAIKSFRTTKLARTPVELRQTFPAGATSVSVRRYRIGTTGEPTLLHLWTTSGRKEAGDTSQVTPDLKTAPFHFDVWQRVARGQQTRKWHRVTSAAVMIGSLAADQDHVDVHYLRPAIRQSPVLVLFSSTFKFSLYTVVTFPGGFGNPSVVQEFQANPYAKEGYEFGVDGRGILTMGIKNAGWQREPGAPLLVWDGRKFALRGARKP